MIDITDELRWTFYDLLRAVEADQHRSEDKDGEDEFVNTKISL